MAEITALSVARGNVDVFTQNGRLCRVRQKDFDALPLAQGQEVDARAWLRDIAHRQREDAWEAALSALERSEKSARSLEAALERRGFLPVVARSVVRRLRENGLVNDARLASRIVESQLRRGAGRYAIRRKLLAGGISPEEAEEALQTVEEGDQRAAACLQAQKLLPRCDKDDPRKTRARLAQALARKGFSWDDIDAALNKILSDVGERFE